MHIKYLWRTISYLFLLLLCLLFLFFCYYFIVDICDIRIHFNRPVAECMRKTELTGNAFNNTSISNIQFPSSHPSTYKGELSSNANPSSLTSNLIIVANETPNLHYIHNLTVELPSGHLPNSQINVSEQNFINQHAIRQFVDNQNDELELSELISRQNSDYHAQNLEISAENVKHSNCCAGCNIL